jgi:hypothetical protein
MVNMRKRELLPCGFPSAAKGTTVPSSEVNNLELFILHPITGVRADCESSEDRIEGEMHDGRAPKDRVSD